MILLFPFILLLIFCVIIIPAIVKWYRDLPDNDHDAKQRTVSVSRDSSGFTPMERHILQNMSDDFRSLGWTQWDSAVHYRPGQLDRIRRAATDKRIYITECDQTSKSALITSANEAAYHVSGSGCSCPDFQYRRLPCKHMYCLAMELDK